MIRVPSTSQPSEPESGPSISRPAGRGTGEEDLEDRMTFLESELTAHAKDLKESVTQRIDRIESRFQRALVSIGSKTDEENPANIIEFNSSEVRLHHLPTVAALEALNELNATLRLTREHLDALNTSVTRMRRAVN